jgi:hypothetical protein
VTTIESVKKTAARVKLDLKLLRAVMRQRYHARLPGQAGTKAAVRRRVMSSAVIPAGI